MADTVVENLITKLSFEFDEDKLEKFNDGVETAAKGLVAVVAVATAAATAIFAFTRSIAISNDELGKFAQRTGIDVKALQELGFVAELNGGSIDSMNSSLENLLKIASEASRGLGAGVEAFGILGISVTNANGSLKDADSLLMEVSDSIARLGSQAERLEFAQKLGIGGDLLLAIQQGSEAIRKQRQEARELGFVIDKDATAAAADFVDELLRIEKIVSGVASAIGTRLMKNMTPMIKLFTDWFKLNKLIIQQNISFFLEGVVETSRKVFAIVFRVVNIVNSLVKAMGGWKNTIIAVSGLLLTMNASALLMPILAIAAVAGILLILEDIIKFAEGGDSAIGALSEDFPVLEKALVGLLEILGMVRDGWILIFRDGDEALEGAILLIRDLRKEFSLLDFILSKIEKLFSTISEGWGLIFSDGDEAIEGLMLMLSDLSQSIEDFVLAPVEKIISLVNKIPGINIGQATTRQERQPVSENVLQQSNITNTSNNKPTINININGGDTAQVRKTISDVLAQEYSGAQTNLASNVEY